MGLEDYSGVRGIRSSAYCIPLMWQAQCSAFHPQSPSAQQRAPPVIQILWSITSESFLIMFLHFHPTIIPSANSVHSAFKTCSSMNQCFPPSPLPLQSIFASGQYEVPLLPLSCPYNLFSLK